MSPFDLYECVVGIECHVQLNTKTKLFTPASNQFGKEPNTNIDTVDVGLPGSLPVINKSAVDSAIKLGLALGCQINKESIFARKHYFYPDLPKGYQISQYEKPICGPGKIEFEVNGKPKTIRIHRIHIEDDAGKNIHVEGGSSSYVDFNRAGTPLLEVVTEADMRNADEAMAFIKALRNLVMYLEICDGNMQEGSMRADVNVSVMKTGAEKFGTRTETKNLNSIRFAGQAIEYEKRRQILDLEDGKTIQQETRLWDANLKESRPMRTKEEANDYRYFPDPDLPPLVLETEQIDRIRNNLPETPSQKLVRLVSLGVSKYNAEILIDDKLLSDYFEAALSVHNNPKGVSNWIINELLRETKATESEEEGFSALIAPEKIGELVSLIDSNQISGKIAKVVFAKLLADPEISPKQYVVEHNLIVEKDEGALTAIIDNVIAQNPAEVEKYKSGKVQVFGFLMGQVMKLSKGKASPKDASRLLKEKLN